VPEVSAFRVNLDFDRRQYEFFATAIESAYQTTKVIAIDIEQVKAKRKKFDSDKEEMKWQRME